MVFRSLKPFKRVLMLLLIIGLPSILVGAWLLIKPFNLISRLAVLLSPWRKLLPYIVAQARHETNDFKSTVLKRENNFFGMKTATRRKQYGSPGNVSPEGNTYQHYPLRVVSVMDYLLWLEFTKFPKEVRDSDHFAMELYNRGYFGSSSTALSIYQGGLKRFAA